MAKFKVGDKVRVVKNVSDIPEKGAYIGKEYIISKVRPFGSNRKNLQSYEIETTYVVYESELELVSLPEIHITTNGMATTAVLKENGKITKKVSSKCSPYDTFDFKTGAKIAMDRLFTEKEPFKPYLAYLDGSNCGYIGEKTEQTDLAGTVLFVGDIVDLYNTSGYTSGYRGEHVIVATDIQLDDKRMIGLKGIVFDNGRSGAWSIIKKRSYSETAECEQIGYIRYIKSENTK